MPAGRGSLALSAASRSPAIVVPARPVRFYHAHVLIISVILASDKSASGQGPKAADGEH